MSGLHGWMNAMALLSEKTAHSLWTASWQAAILIALVLLVTLLSRRASAAFRYGLWCIVLIRLCFPIGISLPFGLGHTLVGAAESVKAYLFKEKAPVAVAMRPQSELQPSIRAINPMPVGSISNRSLRAREAAPRAEANPYAIAWTAIAAGLAVTLLRRMRRVHRVIASLPEVSRSEILGRLEALRSRLGVKQAVSLRCAALSLEGSGPMVIGIRRPAIILPREMIEQWSAEDLEAVLAHELAHIRRHDLLVNWVQMIVQIVYFFHPLVWLANWQLRREREWVCDDLAVAHLDGRRSAYSHGILRVIEETQLRFSFAAGIGLAERRHFLSDRIRRIMSSRYRMYRQLGWMSAAMLMGVGLVCVALASDRIETETHTALANTETPAKTNPDDSTKHLLMEIIANTTLTLGNHERGVIETESNALNVAKIIIEPTLAKKIVKIDISILDSTEARIGHQLSEPIGWGHQNYNSWIQIKGKDKDTPLMMNGHVEILPEGKIQITVSASATRKPSPEELKFMLWREKRDKTAFLLGDLAIKIAKWRKANGRLPESLDEAKVESPIDPYSAKGERVRYEKQDGRIVVYSCGGNGIYGDEDDVMLIPDVTIIASLRKDLYPLPKDTGKEKEETKLTTETRSTSTGRKMIEKVPDLGWGKGRECTFTGALEAALSVTRHPASYSDLMGWSGLAFRTRWYQGPSGNRWCLSSPVGEFPEEMNAIEKATGWKLRCICELDKPEIHMERFAPDVKRSIDAGIPVLAYDEKLHVTVLCGYEDDGNKVVMKDYFNGTRTIPMSRVGAQLELIENPAQGFSAKEAYAAGLKMAVESWDRKYDQGKQPTPYHYGKEALKQWRDDIAAYDKWTDEERKNLFLVSWWCFTSLEDARNAAIEFIPAHVQEMPEKARPLLLEALEIYKEEHEMLDSVYKSKNAFQGSWNGEAIKDWTPEVRAKEIRILEQVTEMEEKAIGKIAEAIGLKIEKEETTMAAETQSASAGKKIIEGVPDLGWGKGRECTFTGALEAALSVTRHPASNSDLMGWSALAFRTRWYRGESAEKRWCPSSPVGEFSEEINPIEKATGWKLRCINEMDKPEPHMERYAAMVKRAIDAGIPVLAYEEKLNMGVLSGYEDGGQKVVMRDYYVPARTIPMSQVGPLLIFIENPTEALPAKEAYVAGLEHAVESWSQKYDPQGKSVLGRPYRYGAEALQQWHDDIASYDKWTEKERETLFFVSWWCFTSLTDARNAAIEFIPAHAQEMPEKARPLLLEAVALYKEEHMVLDSAYKNKNAFLGPWSGKTIKDWTPEVRTEEMRILAESLQIEKKAIGKIGEALAVK